jgi:predicted Zn-dependent protease
MVKTILEKDIASALSQYRELKAHQANEYDFKESELNELGYRMLQTRKVKEAIELFKLNAEAYPQSANVYDSLAEAYMASGDKELAIKNYKKSLELDAKNANAVEMLKKLNAN